MSPDQEIIRRFIDGIVADAKPTRVILFGSAARGDMRPDSDYDFLVIVPDYVQTGQIERKLYGRWWGIPVAKDFVVVTEGETRDYADNPALLIHPALREGVVVYAA